MEDFEDQIFEEETSRLDARKVYREVEKDIEQTKKRIRTANKEKRPYVIHVSPAFKPGAATIYQASNQQCIGEAGGSRMIASDNLVSHIIQNMEGIHIEANTDVELPGFILPESPRLISVRLDSIEPELVKNISGSVSVPIFQCLQEEEMKVILYQYGLKEGINDRDFVRTNFAKLATKGAQSLEGITKSVEKNLNENPMESFVSEVGKGLLLVQN
jgi:hypothetical protein